MEDKYREFGEVNLEFYAQRDHKTGIGIGRPLTKTIMPRERYLLNMKGEFVTNDDGMAIRV